MSETDRFVKVQYFYRLINETRVDSFTMIAKMSKISEMSLLSCVLTRASAQSPTRKV